MSCLCYIEGVGACHSNWRELDDELMNNSLVIVDSREGAMKEAGDIILSKVISFIHSLPARNFILFLHL